MSQESGIRFEDLKEGQEHSYTMVLEANKIQAFAELVEDTAPVHVDRSHAVSMGYDDTIAHGLLVGAGFSRSLGMFLPGGDTVIHQLKLDYRAPVYPGDSLTYTVRVARVLAPVKTVLLTLTAYKQKDVQVCSGSATCVYKH